MLVRFMDLLVLPDGTRAGPLFVHTPNGGKRSPVEAAILKGQGVRPGWPDYTLYIARMPYHGLVLEIKAECGSKPTTNQLDNLQRAQEQGYRADVAWGFDQARAQIETYLDLPAWPNQ